MIFLYNVLEIFILIITSPLILFKFFTNPRFRYKIKDRFLPSYKIEEKAYFLIHASSFGEVKTLTEVVDFLEQYLNRKAIFSVFTDTGYKFIKDRESFIMPVDIYPLYKKIFNVQPEIAMFFETEIWPSYITFLKNKGTKLALINARMSNRSFKLYKLFSLLFKRVIGSFDIIIAKSKEDAQRFMYFNNNVVICGNIKQIKQPKSISNNEKESIVKKFFIKTDKPILTFGSMHKEEIVFTKKAVEMLVDSFFIIIAPRHNEYADEFYSACLNIANTKKRSQKQKASDILILDSMGELESLYKVSDIVFIGGSTKKTLKGHNPIEPLVYNKFIVCGPYMESFKTEVKLLLEEKLITIVNNVNDLAKISLEYIKRKETINSRSYFDKLSNILECYIKHLKIINKK